MPTNNEARTTLGVVAGSLEATDARLATVHSMVNELDVRKNNLLFILPENDEPADPEKSNEASEILAKANYLDSIIQAP